MYPYFKGVIAINAGTLLKQEREKKGLTFQDVEKITKIRVKYLMAMENNSLEELMEVVYAIHFIRSYARFLEIKKDALAELLPEKTWAQDAPAMEEPAVVSRPWWVRLVNKLYGQPANNNTVGAS
ncbi:hypothetical protein DCCM_3854 [Desulfocucumis palustris]|uniref:HTH cro/C1-type domain-containing protein n=1 Tax=Desulfocucumis palustris TaxID=1898651 RepID=A0A2L2XFD6_9FIRM|nr:helix-turn-helix domain-containing protein [Desulfocucumis palustris]GBF34734.1 hypothetical protein DCCM_3854 [Desulfocucumis palustris]